VTSEKNIDAVLFANRLPGSQVFKIQKVLGGTDINVIDRNMLILEVFDRRAMTKEAKLQIELAKLKYTFSWGKEFLRLKGILGEQVGWSGPGEYAYADYERGARKRISHVENELRDAYAKKTTLREHHKEHGLPIVARADYTLKQIAPKVPLLICINKVDKSDESRVEEGKGLVSRVFPGIPQVTLSALKGRNIEEVLRLSYQHLNDGSKLETLELPTST